MLMSAHTRCSRCLSQARLRRGRSYPEGRRRKGLSQCRGLPGLGPPREPGRCGFAVYRRDVASLQTRELPALLDQLQELRQGNRARGRGRGAGTTRTLHVTSRSLTRLQFGEARTSGRNGCNHHGGTGKGKGGCRPYQAGPELGEHLRTLISALQKRFRSVHDLAKPECPMYPPKKGRTRQNLKASIGQNMPADAPLRTKRPIHA
ncbi:hypothetical protein H8959_009955 [Pygathrix nigripes]